MKNHSTYIFPLNELSTTHFEWVEAMNWHNKTVLEALALIYSEVGEAMAECFGHSITTNFGEELADIMLRCMDLAVWQKINLDEQIDADRKYVGFGFANTAVLDGLRTVVIQLARATNAARKEQIQAEFGLYLARAVHAVMHTAYIADVDLKAAIEAKMAKNAINGTRGRRI